MLLLPIQILAMQKRINREKMKQKPGSRDRKYAKKVVSHILDLNFIA